MAQYIDKAAVVAEIERKIRTEQGYSSGDAECGYLDCAREILSFLDTLEVKDPYEQCIQYPSVKDSIKDHAETYSFNIESELFNQLTKEQQALWRKEIEQACISGGGAGVELARDPRYKENVEMKEVDFEKEWKEYFKYRGDVATVNIKHLAKHFYELGLKAQEEPELTVDDIMKLDALLISMWQSKSPNKYEEILKQFKAQKGEQQ